MTGIGIAGFAGIVVALLLIGILQPEDPGAVALIVLLGQGLVATVWGVIKLFTNWKGKA